MKHELLCLFLLIASLSWANSFPLNGPGTITTFKSNPFDLAGFSSSSPWGNVYFSTTYQRGSVTFGSFQVTDPNTGAILMHGLFKSAYLNGSVFEATFYSFSGLTTLHNQRVMLVEYLDFPTMTIQHGLLSAVETPEPGTLGMFVLGIGIVGAIMKKATAEVK